jgi:putative flippase GtrA
MALKDDFPGWKFRKVEGWRNLPNALAYEGATVSRFLLVGMLNALATLALFLLFFKSAGLHYLIANILAFVTWVWFGFELQRIWAFRAQRTSAAFAKYLLNQLAFAACGTAVLWTLVEIGKVRTEYSYVLSLGVVSAGVYISSRVWVFRSSRTTR